MGVSLHNTTQTIHTNMALNSWMGYDPLFEIRNIHSQVDDVFHDFFQVQGKGSAWLPVVDVKESEQGFTIHAELPGLKKEDIHVDVNDGVLTLSGEKKDEKKEESERYHRYVLHSHTLLHPRFHLVLLIPFLFHSNCMQG
jgi:HSP20 family molecular chaperone IbpA